MKLLLLLFAAVVANAATLGSRKCSYGPSYWCGTITQAQECGALQYCLDNNWAKIKTTESSFCTVCKAGINALREELSKTSTENEIVDFVEKFCKDLGALAEDCKLVIDAYGPEVLKSLIQKLKPEQVCALMGFCKGETFTPKQQKDNSAEIFALVMTKSSSKFMKLLTSQVEGNADTCTDCANFMGDVKNILNNATVEQMITNEIEMVCNLLGSYKDECKLIVSTLVPQGIGQLVQKFVPKDVCTEIGFCKSSLLGMEDPVPEPPPNDPCSDCKAFMGDVKTLLSNSTVQNMIKQDLLTACNALGSFAPQCQQYVSQYASLVFGIALQYFDPNTICGYTGFCKAEDAPRKLLFVPNDLCSDCTTAVKDVTMLLKDPNVQTAITHELENICDDIGSLGPQCKQYVDQYAPLVFNLALQYLTPSAVCGALGLCAAEDPEALPEPGDICTDCENFVKDFDSVLNNYTVQEKLLKDLLVLCKFIPTYQSECEQYLPQYGGLVFEVIAGLLQPKTICKDLRLCQQEITLVAEADPTTPAPGDPCSECEAIFKDIQTLLSDPTVQKMVITEVEALCNNLGGLAPICKNYVDQYGPLVISTLVQYIMPQQFCSLAGLCTSDLPEWFLKLKMPQVNSDLCTDCKALVNDADGLLKNATVQKMFLNDLTVVCKYFGGLSGECKQLILEYGPLVFDLLASYIDPTTICDEIGLCPSLITLGANKCSDCTSFFQDVSTILNTPSVQQMILQEIETLCNDLGTLGPQCQQYVSQYGPLVINFILQYLDPNTICKEIGFCSGSCQSSPKQFDLNADQCSDCKAFFQDVSAILNNPSTQQMILQDIENLCNDLGTLGPQCQQYVSEYGPLVINFLLQYLDPSAICGDIGFCMSVSRPPMKLVSMNADQCTDCKAFLQDVSTLLNNPSTQQMILQDIENLCNDLGSLGPQCQQYVSEYGPLVINFLLQYFDPNALCADIGFCSSLSAPPLNGDHCADCKSFFGDVATLLNNATVQQMILQEIENLCNDLGSAGPQCKQYVTAYGPVVFNFLLQYLDPSAICGDIGFCSAVSRPPTKLFGVNADQCTDCKNFFQDVSTILNNPSTQQMILQDIENLCNDLGSLGPQCQQYVSEYGPLVINFLLQYLDPTGICGEIGFCPSLTIIPATELVAAHPISRLDQAPPSEGPVACRICKMVVQKVEVLLKDKKTEAEITAALERFCSVLPTSLSKQCEAFIDQYGPVIIQLLVNQMDPQQVCSYIRLCQNNQEVQYQAGGLCTVCEFAMTELDKILLEQSTISDVEAALDKLCSLLPATVRDSCQSFVDTYAETVVQLIVKEVSPKLICRAIGVCNTQQPICAVQKYEILPTCPLCTFVVRWLEKEISSESTVSEIEQLMKVVCSYVPQTMRSECQTFVDKYIPQVINLLVTFVRPRIVCTALHMCIIEEVPAPEPQVEASEFCAICEFAMSELDKLLTQPSSEAAIEKALNQVCGLLPATVSETCKSFVSQYTREIIFLIAQSVSPKEVCTALTLCTTESVKEVEEQKFLEPIMEDDFEASAECIVCEFAFKELEEQLQKNATEEEIKAALQEMCTLLPESIREDCNILVTYYTTEVIYQLIRKYPANKICTLLRVCAEVDGELTAVTPFDEQVTPECAICELVARELETMLQKNATEDQIRKALNFVCDRLPSTVAKDCEMFVDYYTEEIIFILVSQFPPDKICSSLQLCSTADVRVGEQETPVKADETKSSSPECVICEFVARELEGMLQKNSTQAEIVQALESVCSRLPSTVGKDCMMFVDYYTEEIIFILVSQFPPDKLCTTLKLCGQTTPAEVEVTEPKASSVTCELCNYAMKYLESMLSDNATEAEIEAALEKVCSLVPSSYKSECDYFVQEYTAEIIKLILNEVSPSEVCSALGLCSSVQEPKASSVTCELCDYAMKYLESVLSDNATEAEIEAALEKVCSLVPSSYKSECDYFVQEYTPEIIKLILNKVSPSEVCTALGLCSSVQDNPSVSCEVCILAIRTAELYITKNSTEQEINKILENLCKQFPGTLQEQCVSFIESFGNAIPELVVTFVNPEKVCSLLQVCPTEVDSKHLLFERCNTGPEFWCASKENADLCNAVEHCRRHVWN